MCVCVLLKISDKVECMNFFKNSPLCTTEHKSQLNGYRNHLKDSGFSVMSPGIFKTVRICFYRIQIIRISLFLITII